MPRFALLQSNKRRYILLLGAALSLSVHAEHLRWHGYLNQGLVHSNNNNYFGDSRNTSVKLSEIAVGANWQASHNWQLAGQGIYRHMGDTVSDGSDIDYLFANYRLFTHQHGGIDLRLGRIKNIYGLYNDSRDIPSARPSMFLRQSIYYDHLRKLLLSTDGLNLNSTRLFNGSNIEINFSSGKLNNDSYTSQSLFTQLVDYGVRQQSATELNDSFGALLTPPLNADDIPSRSQGSIGRERMSLASVFIEQLNGDLRYGFSAANADMAHSTETTLALSQLTLPIAQPDSALSLSSSLYVKMRLLSLQYRWKHWEFSSEIQHRQMTYKLAGLDSTSTAQSYYFQLAYHWPNGLSLLARRDTQYQDRHDKGGTGYANIGLYSHNAFAKDSTVGLRYTLNKHWHFAANYHRINGSAWVSSLENPDGEEQYWDLFGLQASYRF